LIVSIKIHVVDVGPGWGWACFDVSGVRVHLRGYLYDGSRTLKDEAAARRIVETVAYDQDDDALSLSIARLAGHFAFIVESEERTIASVDRIRTHPILFGVRDGVTLIDDRGRRLANRMGLGQSDIDQRQAVAVAMSGYTVGSGTLYKPIKALRAGEALIQDAKGSRTLRWHIYDAWRSESLSNPDARLSELHHFLIERLVKSADGRTIAVPLSAGLDSRFVASGLKAAGYGHVKLFSYGRRGNHEVETAKVIAERLGYPWTFVNFTDQSQRALLTDPDHMRKIWGEADACTSVPFHQDWIAVSRLRETGWLPEDTIVVNGNSGDFTSGAHAPTGLMNEVSTRDNLGRRNLVLQHMLGKHFRLWESLATPSNDEVIASLLFDEAQAAGVTLGPGEELAGIHEFLEYQDRQSKYIVSGQKNYDGLGLDWRLPLWDDECIRFWCHVPMQLKRGQQLYRRVLEKDNWGGVWENIPVNEKTIRPRWIIPIRLAAKAAHAPLGQVKWHRFERRVFGWWMDPLRMSAVVPYSMTLADERGARHAISWLTERYLNQHGIDISIDGKVGCRHK